MSQASKRRWDEGRRLSPRKSGEPARNIPSAASEDGGLPARFRARVSRQGVVLFDLDDTLVVATEVTRTNPVVQSHAGYATVVMVGAAHLFVAVRPFTLAALASLVNAGVRVGFWSAGSPAYVSALAERLIDAIRHMQVLKQAKRPTPERAPPPLFTPITVISLDQENMRWMRDVRMEAAEGGAAAAAPSARYRVLGPARVDPGLGTIIKMPGEMSRVHPALRSAEPYMFLVDNLRHDPEYTLQVKEFVPGSRPRGPGYGGTSTEEDRVLLDLAREILTEMQGRAA
jgi:hypothetical protein